MDIHEPCQVGNEAALRGIFHVPQGRRMGNCAGHANTALFIFRRKNLDKLMSLYDNCTLCPRLCKVDRTTGKTGHCGCTADLMVSRAALHMWEEPCISGTEGSGTVFFSGCNLHCVFCQNKEISGRDPYGKIISTDRLAEIFFELKKKGANNINLVTPTHYIPSVAIALKKAKEDGLNLPIVYNTSGYELPESLKLLEGLVDIWLPDFKYLYPETAGFSNASDYPEVAKKALAEMVRQAGEPVFDEETGLIKRGVIVRHLVLPGHIKESCRILDYLHETYGDKIYISIMNQYTPFPESFCPEVPKELRRLVTKREYDKVIDHALSIGIKNGFTQEGEAASESFIPSFKECEGV